MIDMNKWGVYASQEEEKAYMKAVKFRKKHPTKYNRMYFLTEKEDMFLKELLGNGFESRRAYIKAYGKEEPTSIREKRNLDQLVYKKMENPVIKFAVKSELQTTKATIDEGYLTNALLELENDSKSEGDRKNQLGVYKLLMQLKGLGKTTVVNENIEKSEFSQLSSDELKSKLAEAVRILVTNGQLDLEEFIELLRRESGLLGTGSKVNVVE